MSQLVADLPEETCGPVVRAREARNWVLSTAGLRRHAFKYDDVRFLVHDVSFIRAPFKGWLALRLLSRGHRSFQGVDGRQQPANMGFLVRALVRLLWEIPQRRRVIRRFRASVETAHQRAQRRATPCLALDAPALYVRTDLVFGLRAGGSVAHISGVLNCLSATTGQPPIFLTTDRIPLVSPCIDTRVVWPEQRYWDFDEVPRLYFHWTFLREAHRQLEGRRPSFVYHRSTANSIAALSLALEFNVPFVLEYNGSDAWVQRNWGEPLAHEELVVETETTNIRAADLVVVVSQPLHDELVERGVAPERILVNPNGVDTERFRPDVPSNRTALGLDAADVVIGFIGTFGAWHGACVLADAFGRLLTSRPDLRDRVRLLMIGDGPRRDDVHAEIARHGVDDAVIFTGTVPQAEGPAHLAACDVLVSPHVPNDDGSPFFGSPTKLFEYMGMGRCIVASDLEQVGDVLDHDRTALLVPPADASALARSLERAVDNPGLRARLGAEARSVAVEQHSWLRHTERIVKRLSELTE